nr:MAG TPA: hypothetical protein [Caudoviricetes sp.]
MIHIIHKYFLSNTKKAREINLKAFFVTGYQPFAN